MHHYLNTKRTQMTGFTLIEVLIALLVLSVGLLGLASLQAKGLKMNYSAYSRTQAVLLANDITDKMRANPTQIAAGKFNNVTAPTANPDCLNATCNPDELADHDIANWYLALQRDLPNGDGTITRNGTVFTVTVMWDDERNGATGTGCNPNNDNDMLCFTTVFVP